MRLEVIIQLIIALIFVISWFLAPLWCLRSNIYTQELTPLGFSIIFLGHKYFLILPNSIAALIYVITSALIPIAWRNSRYSLYLSLFTLSLAIMLIITVFIFQSRYLFYGGYSVLSTETGYMYIRIPYTTYFGIPLYILVFLIIVTSVNAVTRARWITVRRMTIIEETLLMVRSEGPINAIRKALDRIGIQYSIINNALIIGDMAITASNTGRPEGVKEYLSFTDKGFIYFDGSSITELSTEQGIILAISKALIKGKPGKPLAGEYA
ncbi:MAG: hypothetical protein ACP5GZ_01770 [Vulcanisaeta sp.]|uniref:hypothetical protein n=1 Tax=Vulcanisaeta sp. TaxID=2020871 RepID=UPI003D0BEA2E